MSIPPSVGCSEHPGVAAAWGCQACARALCPDCAELLEVPGGVEVVGCRACGGSAPPLRIPGPEESFVASLRGLLRMPVTALGFAGLWLLAATAGTVARPAGPWALLLWSAPTWVVCIALLRATAERGATLGASVRLSVVSELLVPAARGVLLTAPLLLRADALGQGTAAALAVLGGLCAPFVLTRLATGTGVLGTLDVRWILRARAASGRDATLAGLASAGLLLFSRLLWGTAASGEGHVPMLWVEVAATLAAFSLFLVPQLAGLLVRAHAEALGFELQDRGERLAWPDAVPRHRRTVPPAEMRTAPVHPRAPIALEPERPTPLVLEPLAGGREPDSSE